MWEGIELQMVGSDRRPLAKSRSPDGAVDVLEMKQEAELGENSAGLRKKIKILLPVKTPVLKSRNPVDERGWLALVGLGFIGS